MISLTLKEIFAKIKNKITRIFCKNLLIKFIRPIILVRPENTNKLHKVKKA